MRGLPNLTQIHRMVANKRLSFKHHPIAALADPRVVGLQVSPAAEYMISTFEKNPALVTEKRILELGSGVGAVGIACGALGAHTVILSDHLVTKRLFSYNPEGAPLWDEGEPSPQVLDICKENIETNKLQMENCRLFVRELSWGPDNQHDADLALKEELYMYDLLMGSSLTYDEETSPLLMWTVSYLLREIKRMRWFYETVRLVPKPSAFVAAIDKQNDPFELIPLAMTHGLHQETLDENADFSLWKFTISE